MSDPHLDAQVRRLVDEGYADAFEWDICFNPDGPATYDIGLTIPGGQMDAFNAILEAGMDAQTGDGDGGDEEPPTDDFIDALNDAIHDARANAPDGVRPLDVELTPYEVDVDALRGELDADTRASELEGAHDKLIGFIGRGPFDLTDDDDGALPECPDCGEDGDMRGLAGARYMCQECSTVFDAGEVDG